MSAIKLPAISITLGGQEYEAEPTFEAIDAIERHPDPDFGLAQVARRLERQNLRISDIAWVVSKALNASGHQIGYGEVGQILMREKGALMRGAEFVGRFTEAALTPGPEEPIESEGGGSDQGKGQT